MNALKTERLTIRRIVADDWKSIKDIWVDFNASVFSQYDKLHITDDADVQPRIAEWEVANSGTEHMFFAVCFDDTVIGYIAFNIRENGYEIGYCFARVILSGAKRNRTFSSEIPNDATHRLILATLGFRLRSG